MPAEPRIETMMKGIQTKLDAIRGGVDYFFGSTLKSVQRYADNWTDFEREGIIMDPPLIALKVLGERLEPSTSVDFATAVDVGISWIFLGGRASCTEQNQARADVLRALFTGWDGVNLFGVNVRVPRLERVPFDPDSGMPIDGFNLVLSVRFDERIGDPSLE